MPWRAGRRDSLQDAVALISPPHVLAGQQPPGEEPGLPTLSPPWHHEPERAEITLISQIGVGSEQEGVWQ